MSAQRRDAEPERLDAPNQQVVREDGSGPADEGTGGTGAPEPAPAPAPAPHIEGDADEVE
jgi:hypothetical protein